MVTSVLPGNRFRAVLPKVTDTAEGVVAGIETNQDDYELPLIIVGAVNAFSALLAEKAGHKSLYLSGAGVANAAMGLPDLAMTHLGDVAEEARRITYVSDLPLLVDIDTGWGGAFTIQRSIRTLENAGVAAVHLEDQAGIKRCGHRPNKQLVSKHEMVDRVKAAVDARREGSFFVMARTDAYAQEGLDAAIERSLAYVEAGADGIFAEALSAQDEYRAFANAVPVPILANMTEFGQTPLLTKQMLAQAGVSMVLYPLSAFRAMAKAAELVYAALADAPNQANCLDLMQTRSELYEVLDYHRYEAELDRLYQG